MKILVTGHKGGLGRYLYEELKADGLGRGDPIPEAYYDVVIHCAYDNNSNPRKTDDYYKLHNNGVLLDSIFQIPCGHFIYASSVDVYGYYKSPISANIDQRIKKHHETHIRDYCDNYLILRLGTLVGKYMRENNLIKMFKGEQMTLTPESTFGFISYEEVLKYIENAMAAKQMGTVNLLGKIHSLKEIADKYKLSPKWGPYTYTTPNIPAEYDILRDNNGKLLDDITSF